MLKWKAPGGNEQNVIGSDHAVLGVHRTAFHNGQKIALHALAGNVRGTLGRRAAGDLVDFVDKHDAALFHTLAGHVHDAFLIKKPVHALIEQDVPGRADFHALFLGAGRSDAPHHALHLAAQLFHARHGEHVDLRAVFLYLHFHLAVVKVAHAPLLAQLFAGGFIAAAGQQQIQQSVFRRLLRLRAHALVFLLAHQFDAQFHEIADHGFHVASHIADFRVLGGFHLDEGRSGESGEASGDFRLAHARRPHEDDVLGRDFVAQFGGKLLPPPAVAYRHGYHALGLFLSDDVFVQLRHDLAGSERTHDACLLENASAAAPDIPEGRRPKSVLV